MTDPQRIRVLFYIGSMEPGGAERQVLAILQHLDRARFAPVLCLAHRRGILLDEVPADVPMESFWDGFAGTLRSKVCQVLKITRYVRCAWLAGCLRRHKIDVIYDRTYLATLDAAVASRMRPTPRISAAVADPRVQFEMYARWPKWLWRRVSRRAYHTANVVLANSAGLRQQLLDYWQLPKDRVHVQPNAYDFDRIEALAAEPLPTSSDGRFRILTVGRIDEDKGHADLLAALDELVRQRGQSDIVWQIIGTGPDEAKLRQQVKDRGLTDHVQFLGVQPNPFPYYRAADVFCLPSRSEGLPNVLIEALACGTPVIAADCPSGPREILADGRFGTLTPVRDPAALAAALAEFRQHPENLRAVAIAGREWVRQNYAADVVIRRLEALFEEVAR
ncbi:MAG: glycosyltransferase [Planctomycetaceae bacterium]|nr:glycosyltransferase [Planctomycetaceae bacterium]